MINNYLENATFIRIGGSLFFLLEILLVFSGVSQEYGEIYHGVISFVRVFP